MVYEITKGKALRWGSQLNAQKQQPQEKPSLISSLISSLRHNPVTNFLGGSQESLNNALIDVLNLAPGVNIPKVSKGDEGWAKLAGNIAGEGAAFIGGGAGLDAIRGAAKTLPLIGRGAQFLEGGGARGILRRMLGTGAYGAVRNPDDRAMGAVAGAVLSPVADAIPYVIKAPAFAMRALLRKIADSGENSLETAARINRVSEAPLSVFDIAGYQKGQRYLNNVVGDRIGTGVTPALKQSVKEVENRTNALINAFKESDPAYIDKNVSREIQENYFKHRSDSKTLYNSVRDAAQGSAFILKKRPNLKIIAQDYFESEHPSLNINAQKTLADIVKHEIPVSTVTGRRTNPTSFLKALSDHSNFGELAHEHYTKGETYLGKMYSELREALEKDINENVEASGMPELTTNWKAARQHYRANIVPYNKSGLVKKTLNQSGLDASLDRIHTTVLRGENEKILKDLSPQSRKDVIYSLFSNAGKESGEGEINWSPAKIINRYDSLSAKQKENLFSEGERTAINELRDLVNANTENFLSLRKPGTGFDAKGGGTIKKKMRESAIDLAKAPFGNLYNRAVRSDWLKRAYLNQTQPINVGRQNLAARMLLANLITGQPQVPYREGS